VARPRQVAAIRIIGTSTSANIAVTPRLTTVPSGENQWLGWYLAISKAAIGTDVSRASGQQQFGAPAITRGGGRAYECFNYLLKWEAIMLFRTTGILSFSLGAKALGASATAQTTPAPPAITRTVIVATKLSTVTDVPLYFKAVSVTLPSGEKSSVSAANGIVYQISGSTEVSFDGETKMLNAGEGLFIAGGKTRAIEHPPLPPCPRCRLGSACRVGTCRGERVISHSCTDPGPEARWL
jgi:hypothetical protein